MQSPNIFLIVIDATRSDHLSCYGYTRETTPNIDRIANEGVLYENAISPAVWTVPSHASLFTGLYPSGHGLSGRQFKLREDVPTLAEFLSEHNYVTCGLTGNMLVSHATGLARGFDAFRDVRSLFQQDNLSRKRRLINRAFWFLYRKLCGDQGARRLNWEIKRWIHKVSQNDSSFFLFVNYLEPHLPYHPPQRFRSKFLTSKQRKKWRRVNQNPWQYIAGDVTMTEDDWMLLTGLYDGELAYVDMRIGQVYDRLSEMDILDDTILIITSDHGENLGEHKLMDHQYCVYDTLAKVPLIIRYPPSLPQGLRIENLVQTLDIFPTIADLVSAEKEQIDISFQGQSLLPKDLKDSVRDFTVTEYLAPQLQSLQGEALEPDERFSRKMRAIRTENYKYIWASDGSFELYDLTTDPGENQNLAHDDVPTVERFDHKLQQWLSDFAQQEKKVEKVEEEVIRRLKALGYI